MRDVERNKLLFDPKGNAIIVTSVIEYEGTKRMVVRITKGYGLNEKREKLEFTYDEFDKWANSLIDKKSINMSEDKNEKDEKDTFKEMRSILFETLRGVKDGTIDAEKAKTVSSVSQTLINSAKVEIDYIKTIGNKKKSNLLE